MNNNLVSRFLDEHNYDVRVSGNGRWIDQKCAFDAVCFVADCILPLMKILPEPQEPGQMHIIC